MFRKSSPLAALASKVEGIAMPSGVIQPGDAGAVFLAAPGAGGRHAMSAKLGMECSPAMFTRSTLHRDGIRVSCRDPAWMSRACLALVNDVVFVERHLPHILDTQDLMQFTQEARGIAPFVDYAVQAATVIRCKA